MGACTSRQKNVFEKAVSGFELDVTDNEVSKAFKNLPCHRVLTIPIGVSLVSILFLPLQLPMFLFLGASTGMCVVWGLFVLNCQKMSEYSRNAFRKREGFGACCVCLNGYTFDFVRCTRASNPPAFEPARFPEAALD